MTRCASLGRLEPIRAASEPSCIGRLLGVPAHGCSAAGRPAGAGCRPAAAAAPASGLHMIGRAAAPVSSTCPHLLLLLCRSNRQKILWELELQYQAVLEWLNSRSLVERQLLKLAQLAQVAQGQLLLEVQDEHAAWQLELNREEERIASAVADWMRAAADLFGKRLLTAATPLWRGRRGVGRHARRPVPSPCRALPCRARLCTLVHCNLRPLNSAACCACVLYLPGVAQGQSVRAHIAAMAAEACVAADAGGLQP